MTLDKILAQHVRGKKVIPSFLGPEDSGWLSLLLDELFRFDGQPRRELIERLKEPLPFKAPTAKLNLAISFLLRTIDHAASEERKRKRGEAPPALKPRSLRATLFKARRVHGSTEDTLTAVASDLKSSPDALLRSLFEDLIIERRLDLTTLEHALIPQLCLEANLFLVKSLLARASHVNISLRGQSRPVIRQTKLRGLICLVEGSPEEDACRLSISGPYSMFRHTLVYGRYLGELLPFLQSCHHFALEASCVVRGQPRSLCLSSGLPLPAKTASRRFDSRIEARFAREFLRVAKDWDLVREPEPLVVDSAWIFPDFEIRHRYDPSRRWLLEIVGFWRPEYIRGKIDKLTALKNSNQPSARNFILCVDETHLTDPDSNWNSTADHVIHFQKRIDPHLVLSTISKGLS